MACAMSKTRYLDLATSKELRTALPNTRNGVVEAACYFGGSQGNLPSHNSAGPIIITAPPKRENIRDLCAIEDTLCLQGIRNLSEARTLLTFSRIHAPLNPKIHY